MLPCRAPRLISPGGEAPPPEAGSAPGHGLPQPPASWPHQDELGRGKAFLLEGCSFLLIVLEAGLSISAGGGKLALEVPGGRESITSGGSLRETGPGCVLKF